MFQAWDEFKIDKRNKVDVLQFEKNLEQNIFELYRNLKNKTYIHRGYTDFYIYDPKRRHIYKATVRDRVLHHAIFKVLNCIFEPTFISTSFSCRIDRGNHKGVDFLYKVIREVSRNYTKKCFVLKCDIRKFFDSVGHKILLDILKRKIKDTNVIWLIEEIIRSYTSDNSAFTRERERERVGIPIGNLTSQIFANIYMNEFDQFIKHTLRIEHYARYTDDFVIVSDNKDYLKELIPKLQLFLLEKLKLKIHPKKMTIIKYIQGIDFLGYVIFPHHLLLRAKTKKRIIRNLKLKVYNYKRGLISKNKLEQSIQSYFGVLSHANTHKLKEFLKNQIWIWLND